MGFIGRIHSSNNNKIEESDQVESGSGITYGYGVGFKFGKVSPGIIVGYDKGLGNMGSGFIYSNKPWISFSVNYDFLPSKRTNDKQ